jgi:PBP1b-binding outer membrane lipoprotein LpoB
MKTMSQILAVILVIAFFASCSRSVTPFEAANNHYNRCRAVR